MSREKCAALFWTMFLDEFWQFLY